MNCERVEGTPDPSLAIDGGINLKTLKKKKKKKKKKNVLVFNIFVLLAPYVRYHILVKLR